MNALGKRIHALIESQGPLSIADFMALCLHDPEHGAYAARNPIGAGGDYITSPEVSQTFGEMCGLWIVQSWHNQGRPAKPILVELGPGRGTLMKDVIRTIKAAAKKFFDDAHIVMVEASPVLQNMQRQTLGETPAPVHWIDSIDLLKTDHPVYVIANEFFDCLPIRQYVKTADGWCEKVVTTKDDTLAVALSKLADPAAVLPPEAAAAPEDAVLELCPAASAIMGDLARMIMTGGGTALIFDYGYIEQEWKETLQALQRHKYAGVLAEPGDADLSAHVDFAALKHAAEAVGAMVSGPTGQGDLLADLGIEVRAQRLILANPKEAKSILAGVQRLIDPREMGSLFKVIAVSRPDAPPAPGFRP